MSLVRQLRDEIVDPDRLVSRVLRKAKILAATLRDAELEKWLNLELTGYRKGDTLPPFRRIQSPLLGSFHGHRGSISSFGIPTSLLPDWMQKNVEDLPMAQPLRELETMTASSSDTWRHTWPTEAVMVASKTVQMSGGLALAELYQPVTKAMLEGIIDGARTRFLDFLLGLQKINAEVMDSESALNTISKEAVNKAFHLHVYGDNNFVSAESSFGDVSIGEIRQGDFATLKQHLQQLSVSDSDIDSLQSAIKEDGPIKEPKKLGSRVGRWMGDMVSNAASGGWKSAVGVASKTLTDAIFQYYGLKP